MPGAPPLPRQPVAAGVVPTGRSVRAPGLLAPGIGTAALGRWRR